MWLTVPLKRSPPGVRGGRSAFPLRLHDQGYRGSAPLRNDDKTSMNHGSETQQRPHRGRTRCSTCSSTCATLGVSYLFVSNDLAVVHHISDRVLVMNEGPV